MIHNTARLPLPALVSAGVAGDLRSGKQLIGADGSIVTGTMPEVAGKTITPGTTAQTAVAAGRYVTGDVVVAGDSSLKAENIAEGVSIFGVQGTHSGGGELVTVTFSSGRQSQTLYYTDGGDSIKSATNGNGTVSFMALKNSIVLYARSDVPGGISGDIEAVSGYSQIYFVYGDCNIIGY